MRASVIADGAVVPFRERPVHGREHESEQQRRIGDGAFLVAAAAFVGVIVFFAAGLLRGRFLDDEMAEPMRDAAW
jgi:hypothetical protein